MTASVQAMYSGVAQGALVVLSFLQAVLLGIWICVQIVIFAVCPFALEIGTYAFSGFAGLTLGHAVLRGAHPSNVAYNVSLRSTMQAGAGS